MKIKLALILKGMAMGIAEVIPGVSGGTIAFITGIYERLIDAIKSFDVQLLDILRKGDFKRAMSHVDGIFLLQLIFGMAIGLVFGVFVISALLISHPEAVWAFFFGLILASVVLVYKMLHEKKTQYLLPFIVGVVIAFIIVSLNPNTSNPSLIYLFFCGMIAICALILPGISGSFILLLLGMYTYVIPTVKGFLSSPEFDEFKIIVVFGIGCLIGLLSFARFMSWTLKKYHDPTLALLAGFMIGSLPKIWPWRNPVTILDKETFNNIAFDSTNVDHLNPDLFDVIQERVVGPADYFGNPQVSIVLISIVFGFLLVLILPKLTKREL